MVKLKRQVLRAVFVLPVLFIVLRWESFLRHVTYFLSGDVSRALIQENWGLVVVNVVLFLAFLGFLKVRHRVDWSPAHAGGAGVYAAFIVSLFVEMYGIPLTIFLGSGVVQGPSAPPTVVATVNVLGTTLAMNVWMLLGVVITIIGMNIILIGWWQVYTAEGLVTDGLYAYSRNPQYAGIILIAFGWVVGWPTILTLALFPILVAAYVHLSRTESANMIETYGEEYARYAENVPLVL